MTSQLFALWEVTVRLISRDLWVLAHLCHQLSVVCESERCLSPAFFQEHAHPVTHVHRCAGPTFVLLSMMISPNVTSLFQLVHSLFFFLVSILSLSSCILEQSALSS